MLTPEEKEVLKEICNNIKVVRSALKQIKNKATRIEGLDLLKEVERLGNAVLTLTNSKS